MIDIPGRTAEQLLKLNLRPGSVFYFAHAAFNTLVPHFFVVLNLEPLADPELVMVNATSNVKSARWRCKTQPETLVELTPADYSEFTAPVSAFDCNMTTVTTLLQLATKLTNAELSLRQNMDEAVVGRLRAAVLASHTVERRYKNLLRPKA